MLLALSAEAIPASGAAAFVESLTPLPGTATTLATDVLPGTVGGIAALVFLLPLCAPLAALTEAGVTILPGRFLDFRDPWGNRIQIVGYENIQFTKAPNGSADSI